MGKKKKLFQSLLTRVEPLARVNGEMFYLQQGAKASQKDK
jgi:hypothetical protein